VIGDERLDNIHFGDPATLGKLFRGERWRGRDNLRVTFRPGWTWRELPSALVPIGEAALLIAALLVLLSAIWFGPVSLLIAAFTAGLALSASIARAVKMVVSGRLRGATAIAQATAVAVTYDLARAAALLGRAGHHRRTKPVEARLPV
jgi:hypothetical protein